MTEIDAVQKKFKVTIALIFSNFSRFYLLATIESSGDGGALMMIMKITVKSTAIQTLPSPVCRKNKHK